MLTAVVVINLILSLLGFYVAWQLWCLRRTLLRVEQTILKAERSTHNVLHPAPHYIIMGQRGTNALRHQYFRLGRQLEQLQNLLRLLRFGTSVGRRHRSKRPTL